MAKCLPSLVSDRCVGWRGVVIFLVTSSFAVSKTMVSLLSSESTYALVKSALSSSMCEATPPVEILPTSSRQVRSMTSTSSEPLLTM